MHHIHPAHGRLHVSLLQHQQLCQQDERMPAVPPVLLRNCLSVSVCNGFVWINQLEDWLRY
jgi:hypothetical protein